MLVVTRIPTHRNDGSKVSQRERRAILTRVRDVFGGFIDLPEDEEET